MKKSITFKRIIALVSALALSVVMGVTAFAMGQSSTPAGPYGTLTGYIYETGLLITTIDQNPDNAYLTITGEAVNSAGQVIKRVNGQSSRGATYYQLSLAPIPAGTYALYGAHGVQGGNTYGSYVVYTYTSV